MSCPKLFISTATQLRFWCSYNHHNRAKVIIALSLNERDALINLRKCMYRSRFYRRCMWDLYGIYVNTPSMDGVPFSE